MKINLKVWRQASAKDTGKMVDYAVDNVSTHMSFLEMLDVLNQQLINKGEEPIAFDHDCREGICGMCSKRMDLTVRLPLVSYTCVASRMEIAFM